MHLTLSIPHLPLSFRPGPSPTKPLPTLDAPATGRAELTIEQTEVVHALRAYANLAAADYGVAINDIILTWSTPTPRSLTVHVDATARKGFLGATVRITGSAALTDTLDLRLHDLAATGDGVVGSLVAPLLATKLREHENRTIPFAARIPPYLTIADPTLTATPTTLTLAAHLTARAPFPPGPEASPRASGVSGA